MDSDIYPMVVSPVALFTPAWHILLSEPMVVVGVSLLARHVDHLYLCRLGILQHGVSDSANEQRREYRG